MPLKVQGPRALSPLEEDAVNLVFSHAGNQSIRPSELRLEIVESLRLGEQGGRNINQEMAAPSIPESPVGQQFSEKPVMWGAMKWPLKWATWGGMKQFGVEVASTYESGGKITISGSAFPHTQALNKKSTRSYLDLTVGSFQRTEPFRPGNMHYLSTLIYQCARHWQWTYNWRDDYRPGWGPPYHLTKEQLQAEDRPAISGERHASAAQIFFLIAWQVRYRRGAAGGAEDAQEPSDVDLTSQPSNSESYVGPVDRYDEIAGEKLDENGRPIVTKGRVGQLQAHFGYYVNELQDPRLRERYVCAESTQRSRGTRRTEYF